MNDLFIKHQYVKTTELPHCNNIPSTSIKQELSNQHNGHHVAEMLL